MRSLRMDSGKSAAEIADLLNVSVDTYRNWERGTVMVQFDVIMALCSHFGFRADYFANDGFLPYTEFLQDRGLASTVELQKKEIEFWKNELRRALDDQEEFIQEVENYRSAIRANRG